MKHMTHIGRAMGTLGLCLFLAGFTFGLHDGFVGYCDDNGFWTVTQIPAQSVLSEADRKALEDGIYLESEQALAKAMEDFCS